MQPSLFIDDGRTGVAIPFTITGTWALGTSSITFSNMSPSALPSCKIPCGLFWQMPGPGEVQFTAGANGVEVLIDQSEGEPSSVPGAVIGLAMVQGTTLDGTASIASGSALQVTTGSNSRSHSVTLSDGAITVPLPD